MFKALNGLSPSYLSGIISFWNPVCNLRNKENKLPNLEQAILNVVLVTSLLPKMLIVKLGIPIDRVPTSKSCVFCIGMDSFYPTFDSFLVPSF